MPSLRSLCSFVASVSLLKTVVSAPTESRPHAYNIAQRGGWHHNPWHGGSKTIYFLRVDPAGSSVVAIEVGSDGKLGDRSTSTDTDGVGLQSINATSNAPVMFDPLQGQQSVSIGDDYLFTVNSGSDTAVMFKINQDSPLQLQMVGTPVPTLGQFPMSVAYSSVYQKACVLNGGAVNGVSCYNVSPEDGLVADGVGLREFGFDYVTPPVLGGAKGSGSDIQFTVDSSKLIATLKGDTTPATLGHIEVFSVDKNGNVAEKARDNQIAPLSQVFGFALDGTNPQHLLISEATFGAAAVSLDYNTNKVSLLSVVNDTAFAASCWAVYDYDTNLFYNINAASTNLGKINSETGSLEGLIEYDAKLGGAFDGVTAGTTLYFLTAENEIGVLDLASGKIIQAYTYSTPSNRPFWTGMAMYPASPLLSGGVGR